MGKKKGTKAAAAQPQRDSPLSPPATSVLGPNEPLYAVIEFHHMLIGNTHKKEAAAIGAAASHGVCGYIFMGGPSFAVVEATSVQDAMAWLADCKRAGKEGQCVYWKKKPISGTGSSQMNNKLKVMGYAPGKDTRMDTTAYKDTLAQLTIPFPLPACAPLS